MKCSQSNNQNPQEFENCVPSSIDWIPNQLQLSILQLSPAQLRRDKRILRTIGIDIEPNSKGLDRHIFQILWEFRQLVRERGRPPAITAIYRQYIGDK